MPEAMQSSLRPLTLCADDFGLKAAVCEGILRLVQQGRLQAVSCMSQMPYWEHKALALMTACREQPAGCDLGLHLNLTESLTLPAQQAIDMPSLGNLMQRTLFRQLDTGWIYQQIEQQWQAFVEVTGRAPDFVDGHQHVHQFAQIREVLTHFLQEKQFNGWVRTLSPVLSGRTGLKMTLKSLLLQQLGGQRWQAMAQQHKWRYPSAFGGVYDFSPQANYRHLMQQWLTVMPAHALLMCHPASPTDVESLNQSTAAASRPDSIAAARLAEYAYLASDQFVTDSQQAGVYWQTLVPAAESAHVH